MISYVNTANYCIFYICNGVWDSDCTLYSFVRIVYDRQDFGVFSQKIGQF